jgi:hypothetical protein
MQIKQAIEINLALPDGRQTAKECNNAELAAAMNAEVDAFSRHMVGMEQDRLVPVERTLLKTYLAWKILHAQTAASTKD